MSGQFSPQLTINTSLDFFYDPRIHGYQGPARSVRLPRACVNGGGSISKSQDGMRCVVAGKESLKIIRVVDPLESSSLEEDSIQYKSSTVGKGGSRIEASRNLWEVSGLKIESTPTSAAWCRQEYKNKILTSARNGELIMWDINKSGSKYERKSKDHSRSIHALSISPVVSNYCITGSSDGDLRVWDLREFQKSIMRVRHPTGIRGLVFSPIVWSPLQAVVGLENGSIYRWDLKMGQRGALDRIPVAHSASVTSLDWCSTSTTTSASGTPTSESTGNGCGWIVSGGLDRCVKVWDLTSVTSSKSSHMPHKPTYTLHPSFQVRRVLWRPSHECEIAVISNGDFGAGSNADMSNSAPVSVLQNVAAGAMARTASMRSVQGVQGGVLNKLGTGLGLGLDLLGNKDYHGESRNDKKGTTTQTGGSKASSGGVGDAAEIWDVRRGWIAKWSVRESAIEGGCTDIAFGDQHTLWAQHGSGTFSQLDLREVTRPIDAIPRVTLTSEASGSLTFLTSSESRWEIPYDDIRPEMIKQAGRVGIKRKALGDAMFQNVSQTVGTFSGLESDDLQTFVQLARSYVIEGDDRQHICNTNAQIAFEAGHFEAAQVWLLVATSLADIVPDTPPSRAVPSRNNIVHSISAPAMVSYSFPPESKSSPGGGSGRGSEKAASIYSSQIYARSLSTSGQRKRPTPASSNNTSPRHGLVSLPPMTPITASRLPSYLGRRQSVDSNISGLPRQPSDYRRPSTSYSASPNSSLKHVGEGALADSDSDSSSESGVNHEHKDGFFDDDESEVRKTYISPAVTATRISHPSPLSRLVGQHPWAGGVEGREDDDDDEASASPRSTDSEASDDGNRAAGRPGTFPNRRSFRRNSSSMSVKKTSKPRTQSATLHSQTSSISKSSSRLSVSSHRKPPALVRQNSQSSILTVTAGEASFRGDQNGFLALKSEETVQDLRQQPRDRSAVPSETKKGQAELFKDVVWTQRHGDIVQKEEKKMRNIAWAAVQAKIEEMADDGDIQTCAMLAILIPDELSMGKRRRMMFIEAYIEHLNRLQLFTCASYIRKHVPVEEIRSSSLVETIVYTACGRCKKAYVATANSSAAHGDYSFCANCRESISCGICRLPVRGLIFQCSVCGHGGHQLCYRTFYMNRPMVDVPSAYNDHTSQSNQAHAESEISRSTASIASIGSMDDESVGAATSTHDTASDADPADPTSGSALMGHPCVVPLCGHYCWIANMQEETQQAQA
ncbi:hypothetical protein GYMLUDRAFT_66603 [Collybiopsis luxurians FD-317 M1]|nr:hypothetical protein GYMLUDRAFT_66603 [Collybiopsis luxurians FD-317 M1]